MALRRTVDLLPEIFRTDTNKKFLSATLDQLTQEPDLRKTQGYVGRRVGPGVNPADRYVVEPTATRSNYQLEPGVVFFKPDTNTALDAITYPGMIDALNLQGADTTKQDRLWESEFYSWDPFCDFDKFVNYSQYFWLPSGPDSVDIGTSDIQTTDSWTVTRVDTVETQAYQFSDIAGNNPIINLARGGSYTFEINQPGYNFWIQAAPGVNGRFPDTPNISSRDVLGVTNNGISGGTVTFDVPLKDAQNFYYELADFGNVDLLTSLEFNQLNNVFVDQFLADHPNGIDGITNLNGRTVVFTSTNNDGWEVVSQFDPLPGTGTNTGLVGTFDTTTFSQETPITDQAQRYSVWLIQYIDSDSGNPYMRLSAVAEIPVLNKFKILFGSQWSSTQWYKKSNGFFEQIPLLTAAQDTLYYQDSSNPEIFGMIKLVDQDGVLPLDLDDIVGAKNYTSPNGVVLTNGLKVQLRGTVYPEQYQNLEFYVEGVGTGPGIENRVGFINGEAYFGPWHYFGNQKMTGEVHSETEYQLFIYDTLGESILNPGVGYPEGAPLPDTSFAAAEQGNGIKLLPVTSFVTPETYTKNVTVPYDSTTYDSTPYDSSLNAPVVPDYLTINRADRSLNAWTRSNRWFHIDVINATAKYNNTVAVLDNNFRAKRPIVEFRAGLELFNFGTQAKAPVNIVDFNETDALSNINGQTGYSLDGYTLIENSRIIFAADLDPQVRNKVWRVTFIVPDSTLPLIPQPVIHLVPVDNAEPRIDETVVCLNGLTLQGKSFWFDGVTWAPAQEKTSVNQAPLFDVKDANGYSFSNRAIYPSSTFEGSRLFGYAVGGTNQTDVVLGFALKYLSIENVGDIVFQNYLYTDTFIYVKDNASTETNISTGFVRQYYNRIGFSSLLGWQPAAQENRSRQIFRFTYNQEPLILDVPPAANTVFPIVQIFVEGVFVDPGQYTITNTSNTTTISFVRDLPTGTVIEVGIISDVASNVAYYEVPLNLEDNPLNENSASFTLGTIRNHYNTIGQNLKSLTGAINGANNTRDLGNIVRFGTQIVQQSAPLTLAGAFLRRNEYELFNALRFNSQEYEKYKAILLDLSTKGDFVNYTPTQILDSVMSEIASSKNNLSPFYWSDMVPASETYSQATYTYSPISTPTFDLNRVYDFNSSNFYGLLIYLNGTLLLKGYDYTVSSDSPTVTITTDLAVGDVIVIREYGSTYGSFVPNTPTKMGLYPAFKPEIFQDKTSNGTVTCIRGHDGSITRAFGDFRDNIILEFESRIFDNLKISTPVPLTWAEVIPGQFRNTNYSLAEINQILAEDFLTWVGWNKLDYNSQAYQINNQFSYNYSQSGNKLNGEPLLGAWRGINLFFYDTVNPAATPWEMLGFSQAPDWWESVYGPAPYTSGNTVLWDDLAAGYVADPNGPYFRPEYARPASYGSDDETPRPAPWGPAPYPKLFPVIPTDGEGNLLSPLDSVVGNYNSNSFRRSWSFGDNGPTEAAWRTSSSYPFAIMRLLALTKPGKFFSLFADRDRYVFDPAIGQYLWDNRYRLNAKEINPIYGNGVSKASYINWIVDYNRITGNNSTTDLTTLLANIGVRLCWRTASFTDKKYLKIYTERGTPGGNNIGLLLPDESYQILLYKNQPFERITYSAVIVQKTDTGYSVLGYNGTQPYFNILASIPNGQTAPITVGSQTVRVPIQYTDQVVQVPYGYVFTNATAVCDFLLSYGRLLEQQGLAFDSTENGYVLNWQQMAQEFLYWDQQGWSTGSLINLNPAAQQIVAARPQAVVDNISVPRLENIILNQNRQAVAPSELVIDRLGNEFKLTSVTANTISFINLKFTAFEHLVILDNLSIFADLIYDPTTGARQNRVKVAGWLTGDWTGIVNAPGFILNQNNIAEWVPNRKYTKGEIVLFKNEYWSASTIIKPSTEFDYALWFKSDYDMVQKGLLPNASNASDQLAQAYNVYDANLEQDVDLYSYGLIGFRPREYMTALNLDDVSQVGLYQQFLGTKGTLQSTELFTFANLGKETAQYDIYEYWAILRGQYGATANRSYVELLLDQAKLASDPSLIQVINPGDASQADQTVLLSNIWKSSFSPTTPDIFPVTTSPITDIGLPTAGYVDLDDVDLTLFSLDDSAALAADLDKIGVGTEIWVAKSNAYDWNVYRTEMVPGRITSVSDNLNGQALVTFTDQHGLAADQKLIIKFFNDAVNGVYTVISVPGLDTVLIEFSFALLPTEAITGEGVGFTLRSARVAQASDIAALSYAKAIAPGAKVWVDNNGNNLWTVLEKTDVFTAGSTFYPADTNETQLYGTAIAQGFSNLSAMVGAPGYNGNIGGVYTYVKDYENNYQQNADILTIGTTGTQGLGNAIDIGDENWSVIGASASDSNNGYALTVYRSSNANSFAPQQLLVAPDYVGNAAGEFGCGVTVSNDENWMYVGAPGNNKVYAFGRVPVPEQKVTTTTVLNEITYSFDGQIEINNAQQLQVILNNVILTLNVDYTVSLISNTIDLVLAPVPGLPLIMLREVTYQLDVQNYYNLAGTSSAGSGAIFNVNVVRGARTPQLVSGGDGYSPGDTVTINNAAIGGGSNLVITVTQTGPTYGTIVNGGATVLTLSDTTGLQAGQTIYQLSGSATVVGGTQILNVLNSTQVLIDTPIGGSSSLTYSLVFFVDDNYISEFTWSGTGPAATTTFNLTDHLYNVSPTDIFSFTVDVNGQFYRPFIDYDYVAGDIVFNTVPGVGATMIVSTKEYWKPVEVLTDLSVGANARFGQNVVTSTDGTQVIVSAPNATADGKSDAGKVFVFDRSVESFQITAANTSSFTTVETILEPVLVTYNGTELRNRSLYPFDYQYEVTSANTVALNNVTTNVGDTVQISTNHFKLVQTLESSETANSAAFGTGLDLCSFNCSIFSGSPYNSYSGPQTGIVEWFANPARIYGSASTTIANPVLTVGEYININNVMIECTGTTVGNLVQDINTAITSGLLPNVTAALTPDVTIIGDGSTVTFDVGDVYSDAASYTTLVQQRVGDSFVTVGGYSYNPATKQITFSAAPNYAAEYRVVSGRIQFGVINSQTAAVNNQLRVLPGTGTLFTDLGFDSYIIQQLIQAPVIQDTAYFGQSVAVNTSVSALAVGAPNGSTIAATIFDDSKTTFDASSTNFADAIPQSGATYIYDFLPSASSSPTNPGQWVFGQQPYDTALTQTDASGNYVGNTDQYGKALSFRTSNLLIGSPAREQQGSSLANYGRVSQFVNATRSPAWIPVRVQQPVVDVSMINDVFMYDRVTNAAKQYFDFFNPIQGKVLGVVQQNIDFTGAVDPAAYNVGELNNYGYHWNQEYVGKIWWDTTTTRFIDPNQNDVVYASRRWGQLFPGSSVTLYQWIASPVPPVDYIGPGVPKSNTSYSVTNSVNEQGLFITTYFFWVTGLSSVDKNAGKTLGLTTLTRYIENPRASGIPYIAPINASTVAIYNGLPYISAQDTIIHIEFDQKYNSDAVHVEYQLIAQDRADGFLTGALYTKFIDSFSGQDSIGNPVPNPFLSPSEKYGVEFRPRQSFFRNRFLALKNYLSQANTVLARFPIVEDRNLSLLNSSDPVPSASSGAWDMAVANIEELLFQDLRQVNDGYKYLVLSDSTNDGLWTIYQVVSANALLGSKSLELIQVQTYDTRQYWSKINWYRPGFNSLTVPVAEVPNYASLATLTLPNRSVVKVTANSQNKWEIYQLINGSWVRVGLQDGTIEFSATLWDYQLGRFGFDAEVFDAQYYDKDPAIETRKIIESINQELLIGDLAIERNRLLILMFNFIMSEQEAPLWLTKTSLIDVEHTIRELLPFQNYQPDNQDFVLSYIREVKPYHVQIREFNLRYNGSDVYQGSVNDFDLPAFWNANENLFVSPILDNTGLVSTTSSYPSNSAVWQTYPWDQWYNHYLLGVWSVKIVDSGSGYTEPPQITVTGDAITPAVITTTINSQGQIIGATVLSPGSGYLTTPTLTVTGVSGSGARLVPVMGGLGSGYNYTTLPIPATPDPYNLVKAIKTTIKFDRYQYQSSVAEWAANTSYAQGALVRYSNAVWSANEAVNSIIFDLSQWTLVPASALSGVDRTMGYYVAGPNDPGLSLPLLISGVDYPGVQVYGLDFDANPGFDNGSYVNPTFNVTTSDDPLYEEGYRDVGWATLYEYNPDTGTYDAVIRPARVFPPHEWVADRFTGGAGFDIIPFDNLAYGPEGRPTYDPSILDAIYESDFVDPTLGVGPAAINVDGGAFVDTYESHAPEELVPGRIYDTVDIKVFTAPGSDWDADGHGFNLRNISYEFTVSGTSYSFDNLLTYPVQIKVYNKTLGVELNDTQHFSINWVDKTITVTSGITAGQILEITVFEIGGGNELYRNGYNGDDIGDTAIVPIAYNLINEIVVFANGVQVTAFTAAELSPSLTEITFAVPFVNTDFVVITLLGTTQGTAYSWSTPVTQNVVSDGSLTYNLANFAGYSNPANIIVEKNGVRARPAEGIEYAGDGSTTDFALPTRGGYSQAIVADNDVAVYVNDIPLILGSQYTVSPYTGTNTRFVSLATAPVTGSRVVISVRTQADYNIVSNTLYWKTGTGFQPAAGDVVSFTTWNDTRQQLLLTQVFVGPSQQGVEISTGYSESRFDQGTPFLVSPFDEGFGTVVYNNQFDTGRTIDNGSRVFVSVNGQWLFNNSGFTVNGSVITIVGPVLQPNDVVAITTMTNSLVPGEIGFRIFQNMNGVQLAYRITASTSTELAQPLLATDDTIYVKDAAKLSDSDLVQGIFGVITIGGERITYRTRDTVTNTLSGLRRGTAGTGAADHLVDTPVYSMGFDNLLPSAGQNFFVSRRATGDSNQTVFATPLVIDASLSFTQQAVLVYIGGILQTGGYTVSASPNVVVTFDEPPTIGYQVLITVRTGQSWYEPGPSTPSNGVPLQEQQTQSARFIRDEN